eukprot:1364681-Amorphochlora_amoeboformis.AAC.3
MASDRIHDDTHVQRHQPRPRLQVQGYLERYKGFAGLSGHVEQIPSRLAGRGQAGLGACCAGQPSSPARNLGKHWS